MKGHREATQRPSCADTASDQTSEQPVARKALGQPANRFGILVQRQGWSLGAPRVGPSQEEIPVCLLHQQTPHSWKHAHLMNG